MFLQAENQGSGQTARFRRLIWFKLYFICIIYDKYTNNTEYDYNTTTIQMGFRRKSNDLFESAERKCQLVPAHLSFFVCGHTIHCTYGIVNYIWMKLEKK